MPCSVPAHACRCLASTLTRLAFCLCFQTLQRQADAQKRFKRDNVAQVVEFHMVADPAGNPLPHPIPFCVANTHLFWDPGYSDVKLWQVQTLVKVVRV